MAADKPTASPPAPGVPFYTPAQDPPAGTALELAEHPEAVPTLFRPLTIRGVTLNNRFVVSPMCQYSADDGHLTDFHLVHLGAFALRGAALTVVEATAVTPNGRISPEDAGLWRDSQIAPLRRVADFVHSQGQRVGVQLGHAGRKASTLAPWLSNRRRPGPELGGWPDNVWGPSAVPFSEASATPKAMTAEQIGEVVRAFADAARRAVAAGVDVIELHGAHGYLLAQFLSPLSNLRTDEYGGSFENRTRLLLDVVRAVRAAIPDATPLFVRVSATEWMEWAGRPSWDLEQTLRLAVQLADLGVDVVDVSSGGNSAEQRLQIHPRYHVDLAARVRAGLRAAGRSTLVHAVGLINSAELARDVVQEGALVVRGGDPEQGGGSVRVEGAGPAPAAAPSADLVGVGRQFLREPEFVLRVAHRLGVPVQWPRQYSRAPWPSGQAI